MTTPTDRRPIGFWLKLVDRLIDRQFEATLGDLTRRHWQVLNVVQQGAIDRAGIDARVAPFLIDGATTEREVADLVERGWIASADTCRLTDLGAREYKALLDKVSANRAQTMSGIAPEDFATAMTTLERVARNLGWKPEGV